MTPHKLRHTAASAAIGSGADVKVVQLMLGHKDATETLNTYGHLWPDRLDEVSASLEVARRRALTARSNVSKMSPRSA
jgi:site-specific recombinase XerD